MARRLWLATNRAYFAAMLLTACGQSSPDSANVGDGARDSGTHERGRDAGDVGRDTEANENTDEDAAEPNANDCGDLECLCTLLCDHLEAANCPTQPNREDCLATCTTPPPAECAEESEAALRCRAAVRVDDYTCDEDLGGAMIPGCEAETNRYRDCSPEL